MENEKEKEYYKKAIVDTIMKIERVDLLIYLNRLINNIVKAGQ